jgi:hypothetical protein
MVGHVNMATDIKEANFIFADRYVAVGSDDGCVYIYDANTGRLVNQLEHADPDVVNCVQGHPFEPVVATSGIANFIKLWTPTADKSRTMPLASVVRQVRRHKDGLTSDHDTPLPAFRISLSSLTITCTTPLWMRLSIL